jgi:hypothetical protein
MGGTRPFYPLCLGGAYLLLIIAIARRFPDGARSLGRGVDVWPKFIAENGRPLLFLDSQGHGDARRCLESLFRFFSAVVPLKGAEHELGISKIELPGSAKRFGMHMTWTPAQRAEFARAVAEDFVTPSLGGAPLHLSGAKAVSLYLRFVLSSQVRTEGAGTFATMALDNLGVLWVGR